MTPYRSVRPVGFVLALALIGCSHNPPPTQPAPSRSPEASHQPDGNSSGGMSDAGRAEEERLARERAAKAAAMASDLTARVHFDFDRAALRDEDLVRLDRKATILMANRDLRIRIAGNADERGSDEFNLLLGMERARAAKKYLIVKGVDSARIDIVSFGEERPLEAGHDEDDWSANRRDDFEIVAGSPTTMR